MLYVAAGTVHTIGGGMILVETQQTSDVTYRLYDYGRPRELHIKEGLAATKLHTNAGKVWVERTLRQAQGRLFRAASTPTHILLSRLQPAPTPRSGALAVL